MTKPKKDRKKTQKKNDKQKVTKKKPPAVVPEAPKEIAKPRVAGKPVALLSFKERLSLISTDPRLQALPSSGYSERKDYHYDKASEIFPIFNELFAQYRILPPRMIKKEMKIVQFGSYPAYELSAWYVIEDIGTGDNIVIMASGLGFDEVWSLDLVHTIVLKRALKDAFLASRPIPEGKRSSEDLFDLPEGIEHFQKQTTDIKQEIEDFFNTNKPYGYKGSPATEPEQSKPKNESEPVPEPVIPVMTEKLEGMKTAGKNQISRVGKIVQHFNDLYKKLDIMDQFDVQAVKNAAWSYEGRNRWPKDDTEVDEICLNIEP